MTKIFILQMRNAISALLTCIVIAACASGGGGGTGGVPQPQPQPQPPNPPSQGIMGTYWDTLRTGAVGRPARASFGAEPLPAQTATSGGSTFESASGDSFPVTLSSLEWASGALSAVVPNQGATASFSTSALNSYATVSIPSLILKANLYWSPIDSMGQVLSYVVLGVWAEPQSSLGAYGSITAFAFGYETPKTAIPTVGTGTFLGPAGATVLKPVDGNIRAAYVAGTAKFSVDLASGNITGAFTGMQQSDYVSYAPGTGHVSPVTGSVIGGAGSLPWNDVSVTASIAGGTNRFGGGTAATSAPNTTFSLTGSATGHIDGAFYGPHGENLGAIWSLSDGTASALGTVGAERLGDWIH